MKGVGKKLDDIVTRVLKHEAKSGETTLAGAKVMCLREVRKTGGPSALGIGEAYIYAQLGETFGRKITRQFKSGLPANTHGEAMTRVPAELVQIMPRLPKWIALGEGPNAKWIPSRTATPDQWETNGNLKHFKAQQTMDAGDISIFIASFLRKHKFRSLSEAI